MKHCHDFETWSKCLITWLNAWFLVIMSIEQEIEEDPEALKGKAEKVLASGQETIFAEDEASKAEVLRKARKEIRRKLKLCE